MTTSEPADGEPVGGVASLLTGLRVLDLGDGAGQIGARILADLGASVVRVDGYDEDVTGWSTTSAAADACWSRGKLRIDRSDVDRWREVAADVDIAIGTPASWAATRADVDPSATWVVVSPFGMDGPRGQWRGSDLTCLAGSGNLFLTGYPDRQPVRCRDRVAVAHGGCEVAVAALFGTAAAAPLVDVSVQESVMLANMTAPTMFPLEGIRGERVGVNTGRTAEIWRCNDGYITFGLRGGPSRAPTWVALRALLEADGFDTSEFPSGDARDFDHSVVPASRLAVIASVLGAWFETRTKQDLYQLSIEHGLLIAPVLDPIEAAQHPQLEHRGFLTRVGDYHVPDHPIVVRALTAPTGSLSVSSSSRRSATGGGAWVGLRILELGSAFAGPLISRYFVEAGADCVRVESAMQPDSMRVFGVYPLRPGLEPLEGSPTFAGINAGKRSITLNLKTPRGKQVLALLMCDWADVVVDNYAPGVVGRWVDLSEIYAARPDLVHLSSCLWGATGPFSSERGYGSQGQALSGHVHLTGWPDRDPLGPYGMISDTISPRIGAAAIAAALRRRDVTGEGSRLDLSQIESTAYTLGHRFAEDLASGTASRRIGNDEPAALLHDVFPTLGDDQWIAIVAYRDHELDVLRSVLDLAEWPTSAAVPAQGFYESDIARSVAMCTVRWAADELAVALQAQGVEAYPVHDFAGLHGDPQLRHREHFCSAQHRVLGDFPTERSGFRLRGVPVPSFDRPAPGMGEHTESVLREIGISAAEIETLNDLGVLA